MRATRRRKAPTPPPKKYLDEEIPVITTQEDIDTGIPNDSRNCMLVKTIERSIPGAQAVVENGKISVLHEHVGYRGRVPRPCGLRVMAFDEEKARLEGKISPLKPFPWLLKLKPLLPKPKTIKTPTTIVRQHKRKLPDDARSQMKQLKQELAALYPAGYRYLGMKLDG